MRTILALAAVIVVAITASLPHIAAQGAPPNPRPSQHGSVSQRIADTTIAIEYNRPVARGREIFGKLVPYGHRWCPCADDATTLEVSTAIKINGQ
jgi:hypothetical protein